MVSVSNGLALLACALPVLRKAWHPEEYVPGFDLLRQDWCAFCAVLMHLFQDSRHPLLTATKP